MNEIVVLRSARWEVGVLPNNGASVAYGRALVGQEWRDVMRPTPAELLTDNDSTASYPLVPWSNRIEDARLVVDGTTYQLSRSFADGTAIHGTARRYPWTVVERTESSIRMQFSSAGLVGVNWPWQFSSEITYTVDGDALTCTTSVTNDDAVSWPAGFGHHPYFQRRVLADPAVLHTPGALGYPAVGCIPTGPAATPRPDADFTSPRAVGDAFVDDIYDLRDATGPVTIDYPDANLRVTITQDDLYGHLVVYVPTDADILAVEPVTNVNNAFALAAKGETGTGLFVLEPGETRTASFALALGPIPTTVLDGDVAESLTAAR